MERLQEVFFPLSADLGNVSKWDCMRFSCFSLVRGYELTDESSEVLQGAVPGLGMSDKSQVAEGPSNFNQTTNS